MSQLRLTNHSCIQQLLHIPAQVQQTRLLQPALQISCDTSPRPSWTPRGFREVILQVSPRAALPALPGTQDAGTAPQHH